MSNLLKRLLCVVGLWLLPSLGTVASIVGIAAGANSLLNGTKGSAGPGAPGYLYVPPDLGAFGTQWGDLQRQNVNIANQIPGAVDPTLAAILSNRLGQNYSSLLGASPQIAQMFSSMAALDPTYAAMLSQAGGAQVGAGNAAIGGGLQTLNTAMDPMGSAKADLWQQILQSTRAGDAARGIIMSPTSAGVESRAATDFNTQWDLNQLQRQATGLQGLQAAIGGANTAYGSGANLFGAADQFGNLGVTNTINAATTPQMLDEIINNNKLKALQDYSTGVSSLELAPLAGVQSPILQYLGFGSGAGANAFNASTNMRDFSALQQQGGANALAQGLTGLQKAYPNMFSGFGTPQAGSGGGGLYTSPQYSADYGGGGYGGSTAYAP